MLETSEDDNVGMERRILYATTADHVSIALWTLGQGDPLVYVVGGPWNHLEMWDVPECREWYERLAQKRMLVRYDVRGTGLSQRDVTDFTLEARLMDLEGVIDHLNLDRFSLLGAADAGPVAISYAVRHPEKVTNLVLWCSWAKGSDIISPRIRAWRGLIEEDWELMTDTCAHLALGWSEGEVGRRSAEYLRESVTRDVARASLAEGDTVDVTGLLPQVNTPTLVLHRRGISWLPVDVARAIASKIHDARLILLDGESTAPYLGDAEAPVDAIEDFLDVEGSGSSLVKTGGASRLPGAVESNSERGRVEDFPDHLTEREAQVLKLVAGGRTSREIAAELGLSLRTIERHIENIYGKIGARNKADATAYALTRGIV